MAKISELKINSKAIKDGEWVNLAEYGDLEIQTRGITDAFLDAQSAMQRRAAKSMNGDVEKLPVALRRKINIECLISHVLLDPPVRNLKHDDGAIVTGDEFKEMLLNPDFAELASACFAAARGVGQNRAADLDDAVKNSATPSAAS